MRRGDLRSGDIHEACASPALRQARQVPATSMTVRLGVKPWRAARPCRAESISLVTTSSQWALLADEKGDPLAGAMAVRQAMKALSVFEPVDEPLLLQEIQRSINGDGRGAAPVLTGAASTIDHRHRAVPCSRSARRTTAALFGQAHARAPGRRFRLGQQALNAGAMVMPAAGRGVIEQGHACSIVLRRGNGEIALAQRCHATHGENTGVAVRVRAQFRGKGELNMALKRQETRSSRGRPAASLGIAKALAPRCERDAERPRRCRRDREDPCRPRAGIRCEGTLPPANMLEPAEIRDMVAKAEAAFGSVDILVNNGGHPVRLAGRDFPTRNGTRSSASIFRLLHGIKAVIPA